MFGTGRWFVLCCSCICGCSERNEARLVCARSPETRTTQRRMGQLDIGSTIALLLLPRFKNNPVLLIPVSLSPQTRRGSVHLGLVHTSTSCTRKKKNHKKEKLIHAMIWTPLAANFPCDCLAPRLSDALCGLYCGAHLCSWFVL